MDKTEGLNASELAENNLQFPSNSKRAQEKRRVDSTLLSVILISCGTPIEDTQQSMTLCSVVKTEPQEIVFSLGTFYIPSVADRLCWYKLF